MNKTCYKCKVEYPLSREFFHEQRQRNGTYRFCSYCRKCNSKVSSLWKKQNPDQNARLARESYRRCKETKKAYDREYRRRNPGRVRHWHAARKRRVKQATPGWADLEGIKELYEDCVLYSEMYNYHGTGFQVDHVIPLKHSLVCGLHTLENLQILPSHINNSKHNKYDLQARNGA